MRDHERDVSVLGAFALVFVLAAIGFAAALVVLVVRKGVVLP